MESHELSCLLSPPPPAPLRRLLMITPPPPARWCLTHAFPLRSDRRFARTRRTMCATTDASLEPTPSCQEACCRAGSACAAGRAPRASAEPAPASPQGPFLIIAPLSTLAHCSWFQLASPLSDDTPHLPPWTIWRLRPLLRNPERNMEPLGSLPWPQELASGRTKVEGCSLSTTRHWERELSTWTDMYTVVFQGSADSRKVRRREAPGRPSPTRGPTVAPSS